MGTVLIVDDEELMRHSLGVLITRKGHKTIEWPGSTGIDKVIERFCPDIVLTDHNLNIGEEKGFALALRLKAKGFKVMLMSGDPLVGRMAELRGMPFYQKGTSTEKLLSKLEVVAHA